jgi:methylglutaconyl-CoA hydratase
MADDNLAEPVSSTLEGAVLTVTLNRPRVHNAMSPQLIRELTSLFEEVGGRDEVRVIILTGSGPSFCAGADLAYMRAAADYDFERNVADGEAIYNLMATVDRCPKPVVGRINGAAIGGGVGLVSGCDVVVAVEDAVFAFSEVRLGLVPAVIAPFVINKIGAGSARELFLTAARFGARDAQRIGLVDHVVPEAEMDKIVSGIVETLLLGAPGAQAAAKELIRAMTWQPEIDQRAFAAELIASRRASSEGKEGMNAFLEKRKPSWQEPHTKHE